MHTQRLQELREALKTRGFDGFLLPNNDEYLGEYLPESAKRLGWLTGFTGSAGWVAVLPGKAAFFTDGRYTLQAKTEVDAGLFEHWNVAEKQPDAWLAEQAGRDARIAYDPHLFTLNQIRRYEKTGQGKVRWMPSENMVDAVWADRPAAPASKVEPHPIAYAGVSSADKRKLLAEQLRKKGCDAAVITLSDSVCWLLNIRGRDVPHTPFVLCYAVLHADAKVDLFIDEARVSADAAKHLGDDVRICPPATLEDALRKLGKAQASVLYDASGSPAWFYQMLVESGAKVELGEDPCQLPKACKNAVELQGAREAHRRDGIALAKLLHHICAHAGEMTEQDVCDKAIEFRGQSNLFVEPSFATISGSGPNGAVVHYRVTHATNRKLDNNSLLLIDSGGQYPDGTTDVTRTVAVGTPSEEMKDRFTRVLKGHIALARAVFPEGTGGIQLDTLARYHLWQAGLDYDHGTGHGVGSFLSVHEGPQRISKKGSDVALQPGMMLSNEPGYYKTSAYGIRIENLVAVVEKIKDASGKRYFCFETLTLAPIDLTLVNPGMLDAAEKEWLNAYHARVRESLGDAMDKDEKAWLDAVTRAVGDS